MLIVTQLIEMLPSLSLGVPPVLCSKLSTSVHVYQLYTHAEC